MRYTLDDLAYIESRWPYATAKIIGAEMGRTMHAIRQKAAELGLKRTAKQTSAVYSQAQAKRHLTVTY